MSIYQQAEEFPLNEAVMNRDEPTPEAAKTTFIREVTAVYRGARRATARISGPESAAHFIRKVLPDNSREHFVALYLDGSHKVIGFSVIATGTATECAVHPREVFQSAILMGAVAIIVGHNHPSQELTPSAADITLTDRLKDAAKLLAIKLLDHVIVADDAFHSLFEMRGSSERQAQ